MVTAPQVTPVQLVAPEKPQAGTCLLLLVDSASPLPEPFPTQIHHGISCIRKKSLRFLALFTPIPIILVREYIINVILLLE